MITVEVRFFGGIHLFTRRVPPEVERGLPFVILPAGATVDDLLALLHVSLADGRPLVVVNRFYRRDNTPLADGDRIEVLRTVVGG